MPPLDSVRTVQPDESLQELKCAYTVPELVELTGLSRRQVVYWTKIGLITPSFRDPNAPPGLPASFYSTTEAFKALVASELRRSGFTPNQIKQVLENLRNYGVNFKGATSYLLTNGYSVYYASSKDEVVDILKNHHQMLLLVPLHEQIIKLRKAA